MKKKIIDQIQAAKLCTIVGFLVFCALSVCTFLWPALTMLQGALFGLWVASLALTTFFSLNAGEQFVRAS